MIRFVYALGHEELTDIDTFTAAGFGGVEQSGVGFSCEGFVAEYRIVPPRPPGTSPVAAGLDLREQAEAHPDVQILQSNGGAFVTPRELWQVLEAAHHPQVKIAWSGPAARSANRPQTVAAVAVPTLNLRIGLVRVDQLDAEAHAYARRLAGIGFEGWIVVDPPADSESRLAAASEIAASLSAAIAPRKPAKVPSKPR